MLFGENASREQIGSIIVENRDNSLLDNWPRVERFIDKVHRAAREFHAV